MTVHDLRIIPVRRGSFRSELWVGVQCALVYAFLAAYVLGLVLLVRAAI